MLIGDILAAIDRTTIDTAASDLHRETIDVNAATCGCRDARLTSSP
jgi:hypothetical protein